MKVLTTDESQLWCSERGYPLSTLPTWSDERISNGIRFVTKNKQRSVEAFDRYVVRISEFDEAIVWFLDWPFDEPDEMAVVQRFRRSIGEERRLIDAPGHVFSPAEIDDCIGLFNLGVQYIWDAFLFIPQSGLLLYNSHDELQYISALSDERLKEIADVLRNFDVNAQM